MADKSEIFRTAWDIARNGAVRFGGCPRQYFAEALRMAYARLRLAGEPVSITNGRGKKWVAVLTGLDFQFGFSRKFVSLVENGERLNCYVGYTTAEPVPYGSIVEVQTSDYRGRAHRSLFRLTPSGRITISKSDAHKAFA